MASRFTVNQKILGLNAPAFKSSLQPNSMAFARAVAACAPDLIKVKYIEIVSVSDSSDYSQQQKLFRSLVATAATTIKYSVTYKNASVYTAIVTSLRAASVGVSSSLASNLRSFGGIFGAVSAPLTEPNFTPASIVPLHSPLPSSQPTSMPSCGLGSAGLPGKCGDCQPGYFSSVFDDVSCVSCPIGLYSDEVKATSCKTCQWPSYTMFEASSSCDAFCVCSTSTLNAIIYSVLGALFLISMRFARKQALSLFAFAIFSALDVGSDLLYITSESFYDVNLWYAGVVFLILPNYPFFRKIFELGIRPRFIIPFPGHVIWLGVKSGRPTIKNTDLSKSISFENHDSFVKVFVYLMTWMVLVTAQFVWCLYFFVVCILNFALFWGVW